MDLMNMVIPSRKEQMGEPLSLYRVREYEVEKGRKVSIGSLLEEKLSAEANFYRFSAVKAPTS
jgi:hypothetical protein